MDDFKWEAPPASEIRRPSQYQSIARELRSRPTQWARIKLCPRVDSARALASYIRAGKIAAFTPAGAFEAKHIKTEGRIWVYARYVGDES